jgi:uncharacterized membrane protein YhhN
MKKTVLVLFALVCLGELASGWMGWTEVHRVCKPLIMITLGIYYAISARHRSPVVLLAILFSLAGDVLLMFETSHELFFIFGLLAFLTSHVFYIFAYRQHQWVATGDALQGIQKIRAAFPIVLAGTGLIIVLYPVLGALRVPVMVYALVLIVMVLNALFRYGRTEGMSFRMVFFGALLFMLSDSLLAVNKFFVAVPNGGSWIMLTYMVAQYWIVLGLVRHEERS